MVIVTDPDYVRSTPFAHVKPPLANGARIQPLYVPKNPHRSLRAAVAAANKREYESEAKLPQPGQHMEPLLIVNFGFNQRPSNREVKEYGDENGLKLAPLRPIIGISEHYPGLNAVLNVYSLGVYALNLTAKEGGGSTQYFVAYCGQYKDVDIGPNIHSPNDPSERHDEATWFAYVLA